MLRSGGFDFYNEKTKFEALVLFTVSGISGCYDENGGEGSHRMVSCVTFLSWNLFWEATSSADFSFLESSQLCRTKHLKCECKHHPKNVALYFTKQCWLKIQVTKQRRLVAAARPPEMNVFAVLHIVFIAVWVLVPEILIWFWFFEETFADDQKWLATPNDCNLWLCT
jgi:hypothetical protein